jgi:hypothetical protein
MQKTHRTVRGRKPGKFVLKYRDQIFLRSLLRNGCTPLRVARRAEILLGRAERHEGLVQLSEEVRENPSTIWRVCQRYQQEGLQAALYDAMRSGRPRVFFQEATKTD